MKIKIPKKPSGRKALPFYWWRRFKTHEQLPNKASLLHKIKNKDFEYSPFFEQAKWELIWMKDEQAEFINDYQGRNPLEDKLYNNIEIIYRKRYNKLFEDAIKDEENRLDRLVRGLSKSFKMKKNDVNKILDEFGGTTEDLYFHIAKLNGYNIQSLKILDNIKL